MTIKHVTKKSEYIDVFKKMLDEYLSELDSIQPIQKPSLNDYLREPCDNKIYLFCDCLNQKCTPVGFCIIGVNGNKHPLSDFYIEEFYIEPEFRGLGNADKALDLILSKHSGSCCYFVLKNNSIARSFWNYQFKKRGYIFKNVKDISLNDFENIDFFFVSPNIRKSNIYNYSDYM